MTSIEFYKRLSEILENFKARLYTISQATDAILQLNENARKANLELEANIQLLDNLREEVVDEEYYDSYSDDSSYYDYDDSSY